MCAAVHERKKKEKKIKKKDQHSDWSEKKAGGGVGIRLLMWLVLEDRHALPSFHHLVPEDQRVFSLSLSDIIDNRPAVREVERGKV